MFATARRLATGLIAVSALSLTAATGAVAQSESKTVATVNGEAVTEADLVRMYQQLPQQIRQQGIQAIYPMLLEEVISRKVISEKARAAGIAEKDEVQERLRNIENDLIYQYFVIEQAEQRVTDAEVRDAYDEWAAQQPTGEEIQTSHILVETEEEAREVIQLVTDGTPFADLAKERSIDSGSAAKGGDLGYIRRGETVEPFETAAFGLQPNTFTGDPVKSQFGYHIILVNDRREIQPPSFEEMAPQFRQQLAESKVRGVIEEAIQGATVERFDLDGNPISAPPQ